MRLFQLPEPYSDIGLVSESENKKNFREETRTLKLNLLKLYDCESYSMTVFSSLSLYFDKVQSLVLIHQ